MIKKLRYGIFKQVLSKKALELLESIKEKLKNFATKSIYNNLGVIFILDEDTRYPYFLKNIPLFLGYETVEKSNRSIQIR